MKKIWALLLLLAFGAVAGALVTRRMSAGGNEFPVEGVAGGVPLAPVPGFQEAL